MTDMHPHWRSTGDAESAEPVKIRIREQDAPAGFRGVSRMPAAIVGIATVAAAGFWAMGGWGLFTGQAAPPANDAIEIHITANGPEPAVVLAKAGKTITWFNDDAGPHIVSSETLKTKSGSMLFSSAIFPGSSFSVIVHKDMNDATHEYGFDTNPDWKGTIIIANEGCPPKEILGGMAGIDLPRYDPCREYEELKKNSGFSSSRAASSAASSLPVVQASSAPVAAQPEPEPLPPVGGGIVELPEDENPPPAGNGDDGLAYNPYTVASEGTGLPSGQQADTTGGGRKPPSQPGTGPELWVTALLALGAGGFAIRRHLLAFEETDAL